LEAPQNPQRNTGRLDQRGIAGGYGRVRETSPARESRTCKTALGVELHTAILFDAAARRT
jgi:hypothetical protein